MRTALRKIFCPALLLALACNDSSAQYCIPNSNPGSGTNINKVVLKDISVEHLYVTGDPGYVDNTQAYGGQTMLRRGQSYTISITRGSYYPMRYIAWIDYNNDNDFLDTGEKLYEVTSSLAVIELPFTVPAGTPLLNTRLRVRSLYGAVTGSCANSTWGETEDYSVSITDFEKTATGITDGGSGKISFFNYDTDNDYDIIFHDEYSDIDPVVFHTNNSGTFSSVPFDYINGTLPETNNDNLYYDLCDLNNDNALDLLLTYRFSGTPIESPRTVYYQKQSGLLNQVSTGMTNLMRGSSATADLNNDGRQDVVICGQDVDKIPRTLIYQNTPGGFILVNSTLKGVYGKVLTSDYDNDGDNDILICGTDRYSNTNAIIYRNDGQWNFTNILAELNKVSWTDRNAGFGDFNNDGFSDLFIREKVYLNNGNGSFTGVPIDCPEFYGGRCWSDIDNDGSTELLGVDNLGGVILKYNGTDKFYVSQRLYSTQLGFDVDFSTGDYNNDKKQDIIVNYYNEIFLYRNYTAVVNAAPTAPTVMRSTVGGAGYYTVNLNWKDGMDDHTPAAGLSYNIRVGTTSGGNNIMSAMVSPADYSLLNPGPGNTGYNNSWTLRELAPGTYYWSVQSVDASNVASPFSVEQQFIIEPPLKTSTFDVIGAISSAGSGADLDGDSDIDLITYGDPELDGYPELGIHEQTAPYTYTYRKIRHGYEVTGIKDLNNDNLPDLIARHNRIFSVENVDSLVVFINKDNFKFQLIKLDSATFSSSAIADFDNDGDNDILVHHYGYYLYLNEGWLQFTRHKLDISGIMNRYSSVSANDIDRDNDIDFVISGETGSLNSVSHSYVFVNNGKLSFALQQELSPALGPTGYMPRSAVSITIPPDIVWNDFNFDGFPDLMVTGDDNYNNTNNIIYLNDGTGMFNLTELSPRPTDKFSTSWIDFNKDGLLDIIMPKMGLSADKSIYLNSENTGYIPFPNILDDRTDATYIDAIDVDKDLDKDIVMNYRVLNGLGFYFKTTILTNTFNFANSPPSPPATLTSEIDSFNVNLGWSKGTDFLMGKEGFTYNIWVGTSPTVPDIVSPLSDMTTGFRYVEELGNAGTNTSWILKNLPLGKYYWSVQTIDNSLQGSSWAPVSSFEISAVMASFDSDIVCFGQETHFTNLTLSTQSVSSYYWDFGGGNYSTLQNPAFRFAKAGNNSVKLVVTAGSIVDSIRKDVFVKPVPSVSFSAPDKCQGDLTSFTNTTSLNGTTISSWSWNFGDGAVSTSQDPGTHGYLNPGSYTVTLGATASNGCSASYSDNVSVGTYPVAAVTANAPLTFCKGDSVNLSVPYNSAYLYNWKLNGTDITGANSEKYIARISGSYTATVTNPTGNCATTSSTTLIAALDAPFAPVIIADGSVEFCQGDSVTLSVTAVPGQVYSWRLNGGAVGSNKNTFTARLPGDYTLITANQSGCSALSSNRVSVTVNPKPVTPVVSISGPTTFCKGEDVTFRVPGAAGYTYNWYNEIGPMDGEVSNSLTAASSGSYFLEIANQAGCVTRTPSVKVSVKEGPVTPVLDASNYTKGVCPGEDPVRLSARVDAGYKYYWFKDGQPLPNDTLSYLDLYEAGNYMLKAGLNGCYAQSSLEEIDFPAGPEIPVIYAQGPTFWYLAASNTTASNYKWYFNGKLLEQADDYFFLANQKLGTYQVSIANEQGCYTRSAPVTVPPGYTGTEETDLTDNTIVYPNPNTGLFTIAIENQVYGDVIIRITGFEGKEIKNLKLEKASTYFSAEVNLSGQPKGSYLVFITINNYKIVRKVLIE